MAKKQNDCCGGVRFFLLVFVLLGAIALLLPIEEGLVPSFSRTANSRSDSPIEVKHTSVRRNREAQAQPPQAIATQAPQPSPVVQEKPAAPPPPMQREAENKAKVEQKASTPAPPPPPRIPFRDGDGGCYNVRDRDACCRYTDGRKNAEYAGKKCIPAKPGMTINGNLCEPDTEEGNSGAGICLSPEEMAQAKLDEITRQQRLTELLAQQPPGPYKIFTYWNYGRGADPFVALNQETWIRHAPPGTEIVHVNDSNFRALVPDTPEEVFRMPYAAANSDIVRASVIYHHGGLYMDADFIALGPLGDVFKQLDAGWDIVAYVDKEGTTGECGRAAFSSNFMAGRKSNPFSKTWWTNIKHKLTRMCDVDEFSVEKVCCHEAFAPEPEHRRCHIPWGHLEWLKIPSADPDLRPIQMDPTQRRRTTPKKNVPEGPERDKIKEAVAKGNTRSMQWPPGMRAWCMQGKDNMAAHLNGEIYWQPWDAERGVTDKSVSGGSFDGRFDCKELPSGDLDCKKGNWGNGRKVFPNFFGRIAYHLFFSTKKPTARSKEEVLNGKYLLSEMYRRSLGRK